VGFFFFLSIFFAPIIASIPPWATGGALIIVGALMARSLAKVKWYDPAHAATAFVTLMVMPLTYSIAYGLIAGLGCWVLVQGTVALFSLIGIPKPVFTNPEEPHDSSGQNMVRKEIEDESSSVEGKEEHHSNKGEQMQPSAVQEGPVIDEEAPSDEPST
jgi:AGZA family xanthine/uracil permease-like MFS transporter